MLLDAAHSKMLMGIRGFVLGFVFLLLGLSFYLCKKSISIWLWKMPLDSRKSKVWKSLEKIPKTIQYSVMPLEDRI
ncbi:hypothetical protein DUI87_06123 [Hirundo rustica rustica]|uniref:Uncharacterized protein n=1 Tax=Hirundo rustica rustica TaxID=333673 RepID=A0A3M0L1I3_HIRRU|nr:hypothetical protein DUI87_06123 [Hirundo rustica rustica]